ncbi:MAG TPA: PAS domain S-box protein [Candidatus Polarisedimenticolia bacterium]|nr:PAS domain S-box protein [Candidatus Polarisedimenticolia bacterium]
MSFERERYRRGAPPSAQEDLRSEQLFLILNVVKQASRSLDPGTFFRIAVETIYREMKALSHVSIYACQEGSPALRLMARAGDGGLPGGDVLAEPGGALAEAIAGRGTFLCRDVLRDPRGLCPASPTSRSILALPIRSGDRILALLNVEGREAAAFGPPHVALFEILCEHLANFLQGIRLLEEVRGKSGKIQHLTEICRRVLGAPTLEEAVEVCVHAIVDEIGYDGACVAFLTEDGRHVEHQAHHARVPSRLRRGHRQPIDRGLVGRAASQRRTVCCNDTSLDPDHVDLLPGMRSELCIPLVAGETMVGILDINASQPGAFDAEDVSLLETLAGQLALIMDKARYLERTTRTRDYLESLIANAGDGILVLDTEGRVIRWNLGMERMTGFPAAEAIGRSWTDLADPAARERAGEIVRRVSAGGTLEEIEERAFRRDGRAIHVALTMSPVKGPGGALEGISVIVRDVTQRRAMEESLLAMQRRIQESEEKFTALVERAQDAIFLVDAAAGTVMLASVRAQELTGWPRAELTGRPALDLHPQEERARAGAHLRGAIEAGAAATAPFHLLRKGGEPLEVEVSSHLLTYAGRHAVQWVCRDVSERRRAEREKEELQLQLLQTEKLSAIGQLISGVAHELNNPLTGVIAYAQLLSSKDGDESIKRGLEKVYAEARRCHRIVQNLLTFARKHAPSKMSVSVNDIVESTLELRAYQLRVDNIRVVTNLSKDLPRAMADFHQLQQVFMNLVNNAHQAMKGSGRAGTLTLSSCVEGDRIRVAVEDDGPGIAPENLGRIFDPFFTTKQIGQGTGLGLSICYGIVQEHDGRIIASSVPGGGSVFTVELPVPADASSRDARAAVEPVPAPTAAPAAQGRLLVVDDEPSILDVMTEALRACGHQVDTAVNGKLALRKILSGDYDIVISDLKMPEMSGQELFREVSRSRPMMMDRFVFATGDVMGGETKDFLERAGRPYLEKPFHLDRLTTLLTAILAGAA